MRTSIIDIAGWPPSPLIRFCGFGKRELAQLNLFDLVVLLSLSNNVQNSIIGDANPAPSAYRVVPQLVIPQGNQTAQQDHILWLTNLKFNPVEQAGTGVASRAGRSTDVS
jgi:hypothetical protein